MLRHYSLGGRRRGALVPFGLGSVSPVKFWPFVSFFFLS
jgi:hypothetical protein